MTTPPITWFDLAQLAIIVIPATIACLIGFLKFVDEMFKAKDKDRDLHHKEQNENRQMFIKTVVNEHIEAPLKRIYEKLTEQDRQHKADFKSLNDRIEQWAQRIK